MLSPEVTTTLHFARDTKDKESEGEQTLISLNSLCVCHPLSIFLLFCFCISDLQCANISFSNIVKGKHSSACVCLRIVFLSVYVTARDWKSDSERERHNDNAAYSENILRH